METQLTIKHLAAYFPYGLKILRPDNKTILEMVGIIGSSIVFHEESGDTFGFIGKHNKPILRPLSDLTKEIEVNGEKFVPIIYLAKIQYPNVDFQIIENECVGRLNCGVVLEFYIEDEIPFYKEFHNNIFGQTKGNDFDDMFLANIKPSEIREKLLEWHFNVFNLPENVFVDINTLEK